MPLSRCANAVLLGWIMQSFYLSDLRVYAPSVDKILSNFAILLQNVAIIGRFRLFWQAPVIYLLQNQAFTLFKYRYEEENILVKYVNCISEK